MTSRMEQHAHFCEACGTLESERKASGPLERIRAARARRRELAALEREAVLAARAAGHSWEEVAAAMGTTRQAAWQRWGRRRAEAASGGGR